MCEVKKTITVTVDDYIDSTAIYSQEFENDKGEACLIQVLPDEFCDSPRDWDNLWTWVTTPGEGYSDMEYRGTKEQNWRDRRCYRPEDFEDDDGKIDRQFQKENIVVPLYLYRHSGDVISAGRFAANDPCNCPWDSGCMGFAFVSKERLKKEYNMKRITKKVLEKAMACLRGEVETMNDINMGYVYGIKVVNMRTEEEDSCWGFISSDGKYLKEAAADMLSDWVSADKRQEIVDRLVA